MTTFEFYSHFFGTLPWSRELLSWSTQHKLCSSWDALDTATSNCAWRFPWYNLRICYVGHRIWSERLFHLNLVIHLNHGSGIKQQVYFIYMDRWHSIITCSHQAAIFWLLRCLRVSSKECWFDGKYKTEYEQNHFTKSGFGCLLSVQQHYHVHSLD